MLSKIFISYRRGDSAGHAGRVEDRLVQEFGHNLLFMDVDSIPLGSDFVKVLREEVIKCDVLLAVIGPHWLDARDAQGNRRLDDENDFVRIEIGTALQRDIAVIPILLDGSVIPKPEQLPPDLQSLSLRNGLDVRHGSFHADMDRLISALKSRDETTNGISLGQIESPKIRSISTLRVVQLIGVILVAAGVGAAVYWLSSGPRFQANAPIPPPSSTVNNQTIPPQAQATPAIAAPTVPAVPIVPAAPAVSPSQPSSAPNILPSTQASAKPSPVKLGASDTRHCARNAAG